MKKRSDNPFVTARREGLREGYFRATWITALVTLVVMASIHVALSSYADAIHRSAMNTLREADALKLDKCDRELASYAGIDPAQCREFAALQEAYERREAGE